MNVLVGFLIGLVVLALGIMGATILFCRWVTKNHLALLAALNGKSVEWRTVMKPATGAGEKKDKTKEVKDVGV